jgi:hypothetical protein
MIKSSLLFLIIFTINQKIYSQNTCQSSCIFFEKNQIELNNNQKIILDTLHLYFEKEKEIIKNYKLMLIGLYTLEEYKKDKYIGIKRCYEITNYFISKYGYKPRFFITQTIPDQYPSLYSFSCVASQLYPVEE